MPKSNNQTFLCHGRHGLPWIVAMALWVQACATVESSDEDASKQRASGLYPGGTIQEWRKDFASCTAEGLWGFHYDKLSAAFETVTNNKTNLAVAYTLSAFDPAEGLRQVEGQSSKGDPGFRLYIHGYFRRNAAAWTRPQGKTAHYKPGELLSWAYVDLERSTAADTTNNYQVPSYRWDRKNESDPDRSVLALLLPNGSIDAATVYHAALAKRGKAPAKEWAGGWTPEGNRPVIKGVCFRAQVESRLAALGDEQPVDLASLPAGSEPGTQAEDLDASANATVAADLQSDINL